MANLPMALPRCTAHDAEMVLRPGHTPEQRFCGTWYDCPQCHSSVLLPSPELRDQQRRVLEVS